MSATANRPTALLDALNYPIDRSWGDVAYQGDLNGGANLVYVGFARPGSSTTAPVWQIRKITYSGGTPIAIQWPENAQGNSSNDFIFIWANRAALVYK